MTSTVLYPNRPIRCLLVGACVIGVLCGTVIIAVENNAWREYVSTTFKDIPRDGDPGRGESLFFDTYDCDSCHWPGSKLYPTLTNIAMLASERVGGMTAWDYVAYSILDPDRYIVPGTGLQRMRVQRIPPGDIGDLVAFLLAR